MVNVNIKASNTQGTAFQIC